MATKATGSHGTLIIDDISGRVYFRLKLEGSPATFANGKSWSGTVNGVSVGGTYSISNGQTVNLGDWTVSSSQTVTLSIASTGTSGLGGPTSFSVAIDRTTVPGAPGAPTFSSIDTDQATVAWGAAASGGKPITQYGVYVSGESDFGSSAYSKFVGTGRSHRIDYGYFDACSQY